MLRVKKASINDEGTFTCVAENRVGKLEASATLTVRGMKQNQSVKNTQRNCWAYCSYSSYIQRWSFGLIIHSLLSPLHKWKCRMLSTIAKRDVGSPWICLIIYISKCSVDTLCHPPPVVVACKPHCPPCCNHPVSKAISQITGAHHTWGLQG